MLCVKLVASGYVVLEWLKSISAAGNPMHQEAIATSSWLMECDD
jgi:hypothetical protein